MKSILPFAVTLFIAFNSCIQPESKDSESILLDSLVLPNIYSKGFSIAEVESGYLLRVFNPWQDAQGVQYKYFLSKFEGGSIVSGFNEIIPVPVKRIICLSTTHISYIDRLEGSNLIYGVSGAGFVSSHIVTKRIQNELVKDVGYEQALNYELLVNLKPDVVFAYGVGAEMAGYLQKLRDLSIPVVFIGDYLEDNPLGKAEWIKVFGLFLGKYNLADSLFTRMSSEYLALKQSITSDLVKPKVLINLPWKDIWYFPGGQGYMATLISDAGGDYVLSHLRGNRTYPFSIENALEYAKGIEVWINTGTANTLVDITDQLPIIKGMSFFSSAKVFNNNNLTNVSGGNDFWESGVVNPQLILKDLVKIFHPHHLEHDLVYYKQLK